MKRTEEWPMPRDSGIFNIALVDSADPNVGQREQLFRNHPEAWERIQRVVVECGMVWIRGCPSGNIANAYWEFGSWAPGGHLTIHGVIE